MNTEFFIEADLYYIELKSMGTSKLPEKVKNVSETFPLESVSKSKFRVMRFCHGISEYFPIIFEGQYFCQFDCTVHSCFVDMRFRPFPQNSEEHGVQHDAESEAKFFFKDEKGNVPDDLNLKKVDKIYNEYINIFSYMYDRMTGKFKRYISECLSPEQVETMEDRAYVPTIKLPGDELFKEYQNESDFIGVKLTKDSEQNYYIERPKSPNDMLDDSDGEYAAETTENLSEEKTITKIPVLKNRQKNFMNKKIVPFSERLHTSDPIKIAKKILEELCFVSLQLCDLWNRLNECIRIEPKFVLEFLKVDYDQRMREKWCDNVFRKIIITEDFSEHTDENFEELHKEYLIKRNESGYKSKIDQLLIQDFNLWTKPDLHPLLIEHCYQKQNIHDDFEPTIETDFDCPYEGYYKGCHLVVFVHGFQGSATDMKILKNYFSMVHPEAVYLLSEANHSNTENSLQDMGEKLADEVTK